MLNNKEKIVIRKLMRILSSVGLEFSVHTDPKLCNKYSDNQEQCIEGKVFMAEALFSTTTNPFILNLSTIDRQNHELEREWFIVQTGTQIVFRAVLPKPGFGLEPAVICFVDGSWLYDINEISEILQ